jgi:phosphoglycerol transferase
MWWINHNDNKIKSVFMYSSAFLLTLLILVGVMKLWHADLTVPFGYGGDGIFAQTYIKGIVDNGWFLNNRFLGAPFGANMYDYPSSDGLTFLWVRFLALFTQQVGLIINCSFLLTFFLTTATSLFVLRKFGISRTVAVGLSLLYSFLPYHFFRGEAHFFLSFYFQVPLLVMIIFWIMNGELLSKSDMPLRVSDLCRQKRFVMSALICLASSSMGVYYTFFACFYLLVAGLFAFVRDKKISYIIVIAILVCVMGTGVMLNVAPKLIYTHNHGTNTEVGRRSPVESEIYGLKIAQLLLPVSGHRIGILAQDKALYDVKAPLVNENTSTSLGVIGSLGFMMLVAMIFFGTYMGSGRDIAVLRQLAVLNLSGILLATIGGFGSLFALIISPEIRAYNRIVVFIAFISFFAVGVIVDKFINFVSQKEIRSWVRFILPAILLVVGIYDQTTVHYVPDYSGLKMYYENDASFVSQIEHSVPKNSMIFQLPYVPFPENPPVNNMEDYDLFRGYLHSQDLRWSYGTMRGRAGDEWYKQVSQQPLEEMLKTLSLTEFNGIYIDRNGYKDQANKLIADISKNLDEQPIYSNNQRLAFFKLMKSNNSLKSTYSSQQYEVAQDKTLHPLLFSWKGGFSDLESTTSANWRWCSSTGQLELNNSSDKSEQVEIQMSLATGYPYKSNISISGTGFTDKLIVNNQLTLYTKIINVPPGSYLLKFSSDAKRVDAPQDPRYLVFRVENFKSTILN